MISDPQIYYLSLDHSQELIQFFSSINIQVDLFTEEVKLSAAINRKLPDIVFLDLEMPLPKDGLDIAYRICKHLKEKTPLFMLAEKAEEQASVDAFELGVYSFHLKPLDKEKLFNKIFPFAKTNEAKKIWEENLGFNLIRKLEERPAYQNYSVNPDLQKFIESSSRFLTSLTKFHCKYDDVEIKIRYYASLMTGFTDKFCDMVISLANTDEKKDVLQCIRMYGVDKTRTLLVAKELFEQLYENKPFWVKANEQTSYRPAINPDFFIKYSNAAEEHFGFSSRYSLIALTCGVIFDYLQAVSEKDIKVGRDKLNNLIVSAFNQGLKAADKAIELAKEGGSLVLDRHVIATSLFKEVGKILFAVQHPQYLRILELFAIKKIPRKFQLVWENVQFDYSRNLLAALCCLYGSGTTEAYKAVLYAENPFFLRDTDSDVYQLAEISYRASLEV